LQLNEIQGENAVIHQVLDPLEKMAHTRNIGLEDLASNITTQISQLQRGMETQGLVNLEQGQVNLDQGRRIAGLEEQVAGLQRGLEEQIVITRSFQYAFENFMALR
jgi:hypothetical protein